MSLAHPSRVLGSATLILVSRAMSISACFTNQETMPGFAPQQETAVGPGPSSRFSARSPSRSM